MSGNLTQISGDVEIRKLKSISPSHSTKLIRLLDENDSWKLLMSVVPKIVPSEQNDDKYEDKKYNTDHIRLIENASKKDARSPAEIFLFEWGTTGRSRPTMAHLLTLLKSANLYRAADYIAMEVLNQSPVDRPATGPAAKINILSLDEELEDDPVDANENPQVSNVTIENNLDNSKPQNILYAAGGAKLMVPSYNPGAISTKDANRNTATVALTPHEVPVVEITSATASCNIQTDFGYNLMNPIPMATSRNDSEIAGSSGTCQVGNIVLQSPPESGIMSVEGNKFLGRPNLSELLQISQPQSSGHNWGESVMSTSSLTSCETASTIVSSSGFIENRPNLSDLLHISSVVTSSSMNDANIPNFEGISSGTTISLSSSSIYDGNSTNRPNLSTLLNLRPHSCENSTSGGIQNCSEEIKRPDFSGLLDEKTRISGSTTATTPNLGELMQIKTQPSSEGIPALSVLLNVAPTTERNEVSTDESTSETDTD